jgi:hypothetical protein
LKLLLEMAAVRSPPFAYSIQMTVPQTIAVALQAPKLLAQPRSIVGREPAILNRLAVYPSERDRAVQLVVVLEQRAYAGPLQAAGDKCPSSTSKGVRQPTVFRGLVFRTAATAARSSRLCLARPARVGK